MTIGVLATVSAPAADVAPLRAALQRLAAHAADEPGTDLFVVHEDSEASGEFVVFEHYRDEDAVAAHRSSLAMAEFRAALRAIGVRPEIRFLHTVPTAPVDAALSAPH
jgi:quinol monooxygenase YgiN